MIVPDVSVVLGVRNGASGIETSVRSVLSQQDVALEMVVVNDGSSDDTLQRVQRLQARDRRLRVLSQPPAGLTSALRAGCASAQGRYIARLDSGDSMLPGRLRAQLDLMQARPEAALLGGGIRFRGPSGEVLIEEAGEDAVGPRDLSARFRNPTDPDVAGISHVTAMFCTQRYLACGGYQHAFRLAQDVDLWLRLSERGDVLRDDAVRTESRIGLDDLTPRFHRVQTQLRRLALAAARARRSGASEARFLQRAAHLSERALTTRQRRPDWRGAYFIGTCLEERQDPGGAARYYRLALERSPLSPRPRLRLLRLLLRGDARQCA
jgi:glycosyltransferase involved in cell wall biosynthesis